MGDLYSRPALLITSDHNTEMAISKTLFTLQYRVDSTKSPDGALLLARKQFYLLIIVSHEPGRNLIASKFYRDLIFANKGYEKRVIFVSDVHDTAFADEIAPFGCEHITKPFNPADLALSIEILRSKGILAETRGENRYNWTGECSVDDSGKYSGKTMDISSKGLKLYYKGDAEVDIGKEISVSIPDIGYKGMALIRWRFKMGEKTLLGLDLKTSIDSEDLKKAVPFAPSSIDL